MWSSASSVTITEDEELPEVLPSRKQWNDSCELCPASSSYTSDVTVSLLSCRSESLEVLGERSRQFIWVELPPDEGFLRPVMRLFFKCVLAPEPKSLTFLSAVTPPSLPPPERTQQKKQHSVPSRTPAKICSSPTLHAKSPSAH